MLIVAVSVSLGPNAAMHCQGLPRAKCCHALPLAEEQDHAQQRQLQS